MSFPARLSGRSSHSGASRSKRRAGKCVVCICTRIPFAIALRDLDWRTRSATVTICVTMSGMDALDMEIQAAAKKRTRAEEAFKRADEELRDLLVRGRAEGK